MPIYLIHTLYTIYGGVVLTTNHKEERCFPTSADWGEYQSDFSSTPL